MTFLVSLETPSETQMSYSENDERIVFLLRACRYSDMSGRLCFGELVPLPGGERPHHAAGSGRERQLPDWGECGDKRGRAAAAAIRLLARDCAGP